LREKNEFRAYSKCGSEYIAVGVVVESELEYPRTVAQVDENKLPKIASPLHPSADRHLTPDITGARLTAVYGTQRTAVYCTCGIFPVIQFRLPLFIVSKL
jgi:hypothetical protein